MDGRYSTSEYGWIRPSVSEPALAITPVIWTKDIQLIQLGLLLTLSPVSALVSAMFSRAVSCFTLTSWNLAVFELSPNDFSFQCLKSPLHIAVGECLSVSKIVLKGKTDI